MAEKHRPATRKVLFAVAVALTILGFEVYSLRIFVESSGRGIGITLGSETDEMVVDSVLEGGPADLGGLRPGDRLLLINGYELQRRDDYDIPASGFARGEPALFRVERDGGLVELTIRPGLATRVLPLVINFAVLLVCLALGVLTFAQTGRDLRARLLSTFFFLLAFEMSFTQGLLVIGSETFVFLTGIAFYLVTGAQISVELHMASVTPDRAPWLRRHSWIVPCYYAVGLGLGVVAALFFVTDWQVALGSWEIGTQEVDWVFLGLGLPVWATAVLVLLAIPALRHPDAEGRSQALLILFGVLPWIVYVYYTTTLSVLGMQWPAVIDEFFPLIILGFPVAIFVAIYRYHLFDLELVVRRSLLYTALTTALVVVFYAVLGLVGLLFSRFVGSESHSIWAVSAAMFFVGLLFGTVRKLLQGWIDRVFFPERRALRQSLVAVAAELPARGTVSGMGTHLVERLVDIFRVDFASLLLADPKSGLFYTVATFPQKDAEGRQALSFLLSPEDPALLKLRDDGLPQAADQILPHSPMLTQQFGPMDPQLMVPLLVQEKPIGVLILGEPTSRQGFRREELELLGLLAHHIAIAFENIRLFESATYESLTGLLRRGAILELLDREIERAQRYGRPLVAGMADLDFFKSVNDRYGHLAGDAVLKRVAEELSSGLRSTDSIGRYGGEEFLLVLPETDMEGGLSVAEKLRRRIESLELPMVDGTSVGPRISIGLATLDRDLPPTDRLTARRRLIEAADQALYRAKARGRNRVETHDEPLELENVEA